LPVSQAGKSPINNFATALIF